ncbi:MAG: hypothetical protein HFJ40_03940, partial [Clostridia bacterium]|nr:hypothetical protein [Clostridia bacterium]
SNQQFFENISIYIAKVLNYSNFIMIDKEKNITVEVICDNEKQEVTNMIVNGNSNYFEEQDSKIQLKNYKENEEIDVIINSNILNNFIQEDWTGTKTNFGSKDSTFENYDIYFDEGIEVRKIGKKIFNVVFNKKYNTEIVNNIKVGNSFDDIKKNLGNPIFEQEDIIGYKTKDMYIFFIFTIHFTYIITPHIYNNFSYRFKIINTFIFLILHVIFKYLIVYIFSYS